MCFFWKSRKDGSKQERSFNNAMARARKLTYTDKEEQNKWLNKYAHEEHKGWAIRQRQYRLQKTQMAPQYKNDEHLVDPPGVRRRANGAGRRT